MFLRTFIFLTCFSFYYLPSFGATIKGRLLDENQEPLIGANILLSECSLYAVAGLDGSFEIKKVPTGAHTISVSFVGYITKQSALNIDNDHQVIQLDFQLEPDSKMLSAVVIQDKTVAGSDAEAMKTVKNAYNVLNTVSARTIELSPDLTVANVSQRVSGVSLVRNSNGDPQYAIIRGMDRRYNYTLVNGVKIPSPDNGNRYVPLDIFPSSLLERLEVSKALIPSMEGDAIGGAINMVMKKAPAKRTITGNIQSGYSQIYMQRDFLKFDHKAVNYQSPYELYGPLYQARISDFSTKNLDFTPVKPAPDLFATLTYGDRFFGQKLGFLAAASIQNSYKGTNSTWFKTATDFFGSNAPSLNELHERQYSAQQSRYAAHIRLDYRIHPNHTVDLYAGNYMLKNVQTRNMTVYQLDARFYDPEAGNAILTFATRSRITDQNILTTQLHGEHQFSKLFRMTWQGVYSKASGEEPDNAQFERNSGLKNNQLEPETIERYMPRRWQHNTDQDYTGYVNMHFTPALLGANTELSLGGMYRNKERSNFYNAYTFDPDPPTQTRGIDWNTFSDATMEVLNPNGSTFDTRNYDAHENLLDYYLQGKFLIFGNTQIIGGARVEQTDQGYTLKFPTSGVDPDFKQTYTDLLPSISIKFMPTDKMNIRASYYKAVSRPGYYEIVPYLDNNTEGYPEQGNPDLKRARAHSIDLRWELFPNSFDQLLTGLFYKRILDPIEYATVNASGTGSAVIMPGNYGTAVNWGFELDYTKYIRKFGFKANYTWTHSEITTTKSKYVREDPNDPSSQVIVEFPKQSRPLQGQARNIANLSLLYKDTKKNTDVQLAFVYTGERIENVSPFLDNDTWLRPILQTDFSAEQRVGDHLIVFVKLQNLFNSPYKVVIKKQHLLPETTYKYQHSAEETLVRRDLYFQTYRLGIRFNW